MKKLIILFIGLVALHNTGNTQSSFQAAKDKFFVGYEVAAPSGDWISKTSWAGGRIDYRRMVNANVSVGIAGSWNSFEEYVPKTTYQKADGSGAITSDLVKSVYTVPLTLSAHYYFGDGKKKLLPYAGVGLGTQYSEQTIYFNIFSIEDNNWAFVVRPEVGLLYPFNASTALYFSAAYNYATNSSDIFKIDNLQHFAFSIGFAFGGK